jgi:hypothetical protein
MAVKIRVVMSTRVSAARLVSDERASPDALI